MFMSDYTPEKYKTSEKHFDLIQKYFLVERLVCDVTFNVTDVVTSLFLLFLHIIRLLTLSVFAFAAMQVFRLTLLVHVVFTDTFLTHPFTCQ